MNQPLVSIIVSCYNAQEYVSETLNSLINQTYRNIEIIVVNDGSTDNSAEIIQGFEDERIKYYYQENKGQCAALNYGFVLSKGSLIKFYDADDILEQSVIEGQVEALKEADGKEISFVEWRRFYNNALPAGIDHNHHHTIHRDCSPLEYLTYTGKPPMVQCGLWLIPRALLSESGLWNEELSLINDTEFFSRLLPFAEMLRFSNKGYTLYRTNFNSNTLSSDFSEKGIKSALLSIDMMSKWLLKIENSERVKKIIVNSYVMILEWSFPQHKRLTKIIEDRLSHYSPSFIHHTKSGKIYNIIMCLFGWKTAARLSRIYYKIWYNKK